MEGREHHHVVLAMNAAGEPARAAEWDRWYVEQCWPSTKAFAGCHDAALFSLAQGHTVPGELTHAAVYEGARPFGREAIERLAADIADPSPSEAPPSSRLHVAAYTKTAEYGSGAGRTARGVLIVFCDALYPAQERDFNEWYDHHGPQILDHMDYYAATRYVADDPGPWHAKQLTIYETENEDVGRVYSEGLEWYMSLPPSEATAPLRLWWERPFVRRA
jgi:hypothetical protein